MRRIILPLAAVAAAYCGYLTTVPPPVSLPAAALPAAERVTCEITLPARTYYAASLGRYDEYSRAQVEAARLARRGAAGNICGEEGEFAVIGAVYESRGEAGAVCRRISENEGIDAEVMCCAAEEVRLRVTADEAQIRAMEDVIDILEDIPRELNTISYDIDSGEKEISTARTLAAVLRKRAEDAYFSLEALAGETRDGFCMGLIEAAGDMCGMLEYISSENGMDALAMSSAMKNAAVSAMLDMSDIMELMREN